MQLVRPTSDREFITKFGAVLTIVEFVGLPFEQRSPAACVPQYVLIGAPTIPSYLSGSAFTRGARVRVAALGTRIGPL